MTGFKAKLFTLIIDVSAAGFLILVGTRMIVLFHEIPEHRWDVSAWLFLVTLAWAVYALVMRV